LWVRGGNMATDHLRNVLILSVFGFKVGGMDLVFALRSLRSCQEGRTGAGIAGWSMRRGLVSAAAALRQPLGGRTLNAQYSIVQC
jgi:hypothetical protein